MGHSQENAPLFPIQMKVLHIQGNKSWGTVLSGSLERYEQYGPRFCYCSVFSLMSVMQELCVSKSKKRQQNGRSL